MRRLLRILWFPIAFLIAGGSAIWETITEMLDEFPPPWEKRK